MKKPEVLLERRSNDEIFDSIGKKAKSAKAIRFALFCIAVKVLCKLILTLLLICNIFTATSFAVFCATPTMHIALYYVLPALSVFSLLSMCLFLCRLDPEERRLCVKGSCAFSAIHFVFVLTKLAIFFGLLFLGKALYHLCLSGQLGLFFTHPLIAVPTAVIGVVAVVILLVMCVSRICGVEDKIETEGRETPPLFPPKNFCFTGTNSNVRIFAPQRHSDAKEEQAPLAAVDQPVR